MSPSCMRRRAGFTQVLFCSKVGMTGAAMSSRSFSGLSATSGATQRATYSFKSERTSGTMGPAFRTASAARSGKAMPNFEKRAASTSVKAVSKASVAQCPMPEVTAAVKATPRGTPSTARVKATRSSITTTVAFGTNATK